MRADRDRLADVLQAIERIERHTIAGRTAFDTDELMRQVLVHGYFEVDLDLVWLVVENELDELKSTISSAMAELAMQGD